MSEIFANVGGQMVDVRVYPIPIRADCTVRIFGIPYDLTALEAEKIARVIQALASCDTHPQGGDGEAAPFMSSAVGEAETPNPNQDHSA